jgi:hypothetical protein
VGACDGCLRQTFCLVKDIGEDLRLSEPVVVHSLAVVNDDRRRRMQIRLVAFVGGVRVNSIEAALSVLFKLFRTDAVQR